MGRPSGPPALFLLAGVAADALLLSGVLWLTITALTTRQSISMLLFGLEEPLDPAVRLAACPVVAVWPAGPRGIPFGGLVDFVNIAADGYFLPAVHPAEDLGLMPRLAFKLDRFLRLSARTASSV